jgi:hypothetical protein
LAIAVETPAPERKIRLHDNIFAMQVTDWVPGCPVIGALALVATSAFSCDAALAQERAEVLDDAVHVTAGLDVGAVGGQINTDGVPGFGFNLLVEKGSLGGIASYRGTASSCGGRAGGDGLANCDSVSILDAGLRYTVGHQDVRPYLDARIEYASGWRAAWGLQSARYGESLSRWAFGGRLGLRYRAKIVGVFLEGGPSVLRAVPDYVMPKVLTGAPPMLGPDPNSWWIFGEVDGGITFTFR